MLKKILKSILGFLGVNISISKRTPTKTVKKGNTVYLNIGDFTLALPKTHMLPEYLAIHPYYSMNLGRIAGYIQEFFKNFTIIDVGANIGDSVALIRSAGIQTKIHCIEGEPEFLKYLEQNIRQFEGIIVHKTYLGDTLASIDIENINSREGTSKIETEATGISANGLHIIPLDQLNADFTGLKLLKIDTDGYDFKILRGAKETLAKYKPVIFAEYSPRDFVQVDPGYMKVFDMLAALGYDKIIFYDNYGVLLTVGSTSQINDITILSEYVLNKKASFPYFDICIFHRDDDELFSNILKQEQIFYRINQI